MIRSIDLRSRVGQALLVGFEGVTARDVAPLLDRLRPAGLVLLPRNIVSVAQVRDLTGGLQELAANAGLPHLLLAVDQEGGTVARLAGAAGFTDLPSAMAVGRTGDLALARSLAAMLARELAAVGINLALAPVLDLALDPRNDVIGTRSLGEDAATVAAMGGAAIAGLRSQGILACAKHVPGHGATPVDSHLALPTLASSLAELRTRDLVPFRAAIEADCDALMAAHVVSALDPGHPASLSRPTLTGFLREELGFGGLILTDALEMRALRASDRDAGRCAVEGVEAGADLLVFEGDPETVGLAVDTLADAIGRGRLDEAGLGASAGRLAAARRRLDEAPARPALVEVGSAAHRELALRVAGGGLGISDPSGILPLREVPSVVDLTTAGGAALALGWATAGGTAQEVGAGSPDGAAPGAAAPPVIVVVDNDDLTAAAARLDELAARGRRVVLLVAGGQRAPETTVPPAVVLTYDLPLALWPAVAARLMGRPQAAGQPDRAPVAASSGIPGLDHALDGIVPAMAPAAQLVAWTRGGIDAELAAGTIGDDAGSDRGGPLGRSPITPETRFDLASVTKLFTAAAFLGLVERGMAQLDDAVCGVLSRFGAGSAWAALVTWRQLLSHSAGLPPGVDLRAARDPEEARTIALAGSPIDAPGTRVVYSDIGFMLLGFGIEVLAGLPLDAAIGHLVVDPLGLPHTSFRPDGTADVAPTEVCPWRGRRLRGEVHDESAAALGGVAGHAGLFGTAHDVAALGRCLLEGGSPILSTATIHAMTTEQARDGDLRRGLGVSLWSPDPEASSHPFGQRAFGHTGFTGTSLWVDPDRGLVVALLTNTVYLGRGERGFPTACIELHRRIVDAVDAAGRTTEAP